MLGLDTPDDTIVIADFEAGIGTLTRLGETKVDAVVIVTDATVKSLEVAARAAALAAQQTVGAIFVVANRVLDDEDRVAVERVLEHHAVVLVPHDDAIPAAERADLAPLDASPDAPAVRAIRDLAHQLVPE